MKASVRVRVRVRVIKVRVRVGVSFACNVGYFDYKLESGFD